MRKKPGRKSVPLDAIADVSPGKERSEEMTEQQT
jgi:hypothetical protein